MGFRGGRKYFLWQVIFWRDRMGIVFIIKGTYYKENL